MSTVVEDEVSGLLYLPRDPEDLCRAVARIADSPEMVAVMRLEARRRYEDTYLPQANLNALEAIYREAMQGARERRANG